MTTLLHAKDLTRRYGAHRAVEGFDLSLAPGDILGLAGLNGAGKSTTLAMLAGVLRPTRGRVLIQGQDPSRFPTARHALGFAPDQPALYPELRVREQLDYAAALHGLRGARGRQAVTAVIERCGLEDAGNRLIRTLSRGYRQRVGLALALVHRPAVLLLDEPTEGLDPHQSAHFRTLFHEQSEHGALVLSTHRFEVIAGLCNRLVVLHQGASVLQQPLAEESAETLYDLFTRATGAAAA